MSTHLRPAKTPSCLVFPVLVEFLLYAVATRRAYHSTAHFSFVKVDEDVAFTYNHTIAETLESLDLVSPMLIIACTLTLCLLVSCARADHEEKGETRNALSWPPASSQLRWLCLLAVASFGLLILQLVMGAVAHSLTLLADSAHTAADAVMYAFAFYVESWKIDCQKKSNKAKAIWIDVTSAFLIFVAVVIPALYAMLVAGTRLRWWGVREIPEDPSEIPETDFRSIGATLLAFAVISMVLNLGLVFMHLWSDGADEDPALEGVNAGQTLEQPPPPAFGGARVQKPKRRKRGVQLLHMAFHPNCDDATCAMHDAEQDDAIKAAGKDGLTKTGARSENLNMYGAFLHLATDVIRSVVIFVAGILVLAGVLKDPEKADAGCSIIVGACVILGSSPMIIKLCRSVESLRDLYSD
eukprot:TRINITY_DN71659_c0_g1_i1.p1 TRINITY_DN71659_c0_g1~~TRINITY_DN71659_c0_g1_i1.p1  ORF type:complete len:411 (+),score=44.12 TRINITY_DN71659_c0_g1_i1:58-1290(+)